MSFVKIPTRKSIESLDVYVAGKPIEEVKRELGLTNIIKLASNENPLGCSPSAKSALKQTIDHVTLYPESMAPDLAEKLAYKLTVNKENILISNGSDEIIRLLTRAYIGSGDEAIMADVTFPRYETNVHIEKGIPIKIPLIDGVHDLEGMLKAITDKTKMIFVCNPNNPTGTIVDKDPLKQFIERVPENILLIIDEAYYEYVQDDRYLETVPLLRDHPNLVILRTFSKIYGLASLRVGYGIMHPSIVPELAKVKEPFNTNRFGQAAALASLDDIDFIKLCAQYNTSERRYLEKEFDQMGLHYFPSHGNFLMVKLERPGKEVTEKLLKQGIIVRSGHLLGYDDTIRVSIGKQSENQRLIQVLREIIRETV